MDAWRGCAVTLIALLIEAFLSPDWLNSNGLRFDCSPRRQENPDNNTHTQQQVIGGGGGWGEHAGRRRRERVTMIQHQVTTRQTER